MYWYNIIIIANNFHLLKNNLYFIDVKIHILFNFLVQQFYAIIML